jgi:3-hydroxybutyryl-CoA dehydrogenase
MIDNPTIVAVVGGGRMGAGIAQVFATLGATVVIAETNATAADAARDRILRGLERAAEKGKLDEEPGAIIQRLHTVTALADVPANADLIVEAVPEIAAVKIEVLSTVGQVVKPSAILASNTSSLSIAELGAALTHPARFVGMHFFNPVPASSLVELVRAPGTDDAVVDAVLAWVTAMGKSSVLVNDSPGFATSRLGVGLGLEAIRMLEEGVADAESIDRAMELGYRHPMGPLRSTDLVGLDVRLAIAEHLHKTLGDRFAPPQLLRDKVAGGELGQKTGQGFYTWRT